MSVGEGGRNCVRRHLVLSCEPALGWDLQYKLDRWRENLE